MTTFSRTTAAAAVCLAANSLAADLKVGFFTSLSGAVSGLDIPSSKGIQVANARCARGVLSVAGQVLKIVAARPGAVFTGNAGSPAALPDLALAERGYRHVTHGVSSLRPNDANGLERRPGLVIKLEKGPVEADPMSEPASPKGALR